ncbi:MAG: hypothetical protein HY079_09490, partial [Elusimicrobia bacterium]|nr:hypothetical protein [Elusimicrobiota bacterium]
VWPLPIARTEQVSPREAVPAGGVASISLQFHVPDTMFGRRLYRVFLVKDSKTLLESDYRGFQVVEKPIPPPPEVVAYHMEGNITVSLKDTSRARWRDANGATTFNTVGKVGASSYLINLYILHRTGNAFDPSVITANYYAPWGTIYAGDIQPALGPLAVSGQGMRGAMLEQRKGMLDWDVLGGQVVGSQAGTATTNGRFARSIYAGKLGVAPGAGFRANVNYFTSSDETGSLSSDPKSSNFRGPSLVAQKNSGYGLDASYEPVAKLKFVGAYQANTYFADIAGPAAKDKAMRGEFSWERKVFKLRAYLQRAGAKFVAFGNPGVVGDRVTTDVALSLYPVRWYSLSLNGNQYKDNLANDPSRTTTTQRVINVGNAFQFPTATTLNLSVSLNAAKGQPSTALDNQTTTIGLGVGQGIRKHSVTLNVQSSQFRDKNKFAHDLDTLTVGLSSSWRLPRAWSLTFGVTQSGTKDKIDGSKRTSLSVSPGLTVPLSSKWSSQYWGTYTATKNTSTTLPADNSLLSANAEYTYAQSKQVNLTWGVGANSNKDKINPANKYNEVTASFRYSYTF